MQLIFWLLFKPYQHSLINSLCNQMVKIYTKLQYTKLKQNSNKNPNHAIILHYHVVICTAYRITVYKVWFLPCGFFLPFYSCKVSPPPFFICPDTEMLKIIWDVQIRSVLNLPSVNGKRSENEKEANISMYIVLSTFLKTLANLEPSLNILCLNSKYCFSVQTQANTTHRKNKACIQIRKWLREIFWLWYSVIYCTVSDQLLYITMTYYNLRRRSWILSSAYHDAKVSVFLPSPWINQSVNEREY